MAFYLGVALRPITPPLGGYLYGYPNPPRSSAVHDDLSVTAAYFCDDNSRAILLSYTVCALSDSLCERIRTLLAADLGMPKEAVFLHATHTHSGPCLTDSAGWGSADGDYIEAILIPKTREAAREAVAAPQPAVMSVATGLSYVGINRRQIRDGIATLGQQPDGVYDPTMTVIGFFAEGGAPLLTMVHYGAHCTASGKTDEITRDWPGVMLDALAAETNAPALFLQGPEGDVGPRMPSGKTIGEATAEDGAAIGRIAARDALAIYKTLGEGCTPSLAISHTTLSLPLAARPSRAEAEAAIVKNEGASAGVEAKTLDYYRRVLASYEEGYCERDGTPLPQSILCIGDVALVAFPYELFSAIGLAVRRGSPFLHTLPLSLTNGRGCYFVTEEAIPYGGYEVTMFLLESIQRYTPHIDRTLADLTIRHLEELKTKLDN